MSYERYCQWKRWGSETFGTCAHVDALYFEAEMRQCGVAMIPGWRVLEIGFGNGAFAGWVKGLGADYTGVEAIPELVVRGQKAGFNVFESDGPLNRFSGYRPYDAVVAFDVLEHFTITDLEACLAEVYDLLKEGGCLIARVPSGDSPFARPIQHGDLTHRTILGSSAINQLAQSCRFSVAQVRAPAFPLSGLGLVTLLRRSVLVSARSIAYPILANLFMGGGRPVLTPTMVFVLQKPISDSGSDNCA
jgi:SAM-dependent methyltransferase